MNAQEQRESENLREIKSFLTTRMEGIITQLQNCNADEMGALVDKSITDMTREIMKHPATHLLTPLEAVELISWTRNYMNTKQN